MTQFIGGLMAIALVGISGFFLGRQRRTLQLLQDHSEWSRQDRQFLHAQARRRIICSILLLVFACFLVGWIFLEPIWLPSAEAEVPLDRELVRLAIGYWVVAILVIFLVIIIALVDFWATARFGLLQHRQLVNDQQAQLKDDVARARNRPRDING